MSDLSTLLDAFDDGPSVPPIDVASQPRDDSGRFAPVPHDLFGRPILWAEEV